MKRQSLVLLFSSLPFFAFAEGQAGLEGAFYGIIALAFLVHTFAVGAMLHRIGVLMGIRRSTFWRIGSFVGALLTAWILFLYDRSMFFFPLSLVYLLAFFPLYLIVVFLVKRKKGVF